MLKKFLSTAEALLRLRAPRMPAVRSGQYHDPQALLRAVDALPQTPFVPINRDDFRPHEGREIGMNCAGVTCADSRLPILATYGLATCVGLAVFNPVTRTGGLAHLAQSPDDLVSLSEDGRQALSSMLQAVRQDKKQPLEARMMGPMNTRSKIVSDVLVVLNEQPNLRILSVDYGMKPYVADFGMDTRRWDEGLLKGGNSSGLFVGDCIGKPDMLARFAAGNRYRVDIKEIPPAPEYRHGLYDGKNAAIRPPLAASHENKPR